MAKPRSKSGFTLIEMVVVVSILVIIAAVAIPQIIQAVNKSRAASDIANARTFAEEIIRGHLEGQYTLNITEAETALVSSRVSDVGVSKIKKSDNKFWYKVSFDSDEKYEITIFIGGDNAVPVNTGDNANIIYPVITGE
ncbi:MAG: prepilin-type N-terminal cleavage/methylation domain-containing protein, partial [Clostridium sp.]